MGRKFDITVKSANDLVNADADEGGHSDPFVIVCFDSKTSQEIARTETVENTVSPVWDATFSVDVSSHIKTVVEETGEEPNMLTFCVYDGDEGTAEPLGVAGIKFDDLVKQGRFEGELPVFNGTGSISVIVEMKKVSLSSMLKDDAALKIAGGVAGAAAMGALGVYLFQRYEKKKEKVVDAEAEGEGEGEGQARTGISFGANIDDDDDDDEDKDNFKKWWEMDDENDDDDDENRWGESY